MNNTDFKKYLDDNGYKKIAIAETVFIAHNICLQLKKASDKDIFEHLGKDVYEKPLGEKS